TTKERTAIWWVCALGPAQGTIRKFALVGDSHAGHWRAALSSLAYAARWRGYSMTRASCPLTTAVPDLAQALRSRCVAWNRQVRVWLTNHPEVNLVFISEHSGAGVVVPKGHDQVAAKVVGYTAAWAALPPTVEHIIVIRDTPLNTSRTLGCVEQAIARHQQPGVACAVPRSFAVRPDPEVAAADRLASKRVQVADLTPFLCGPRFCPPVIGGVLVHKDVNHLTPEFSATLGPFLLREVERLMSIGSWGAPPASAPSAQPTDTAPPAPPAG
ncbi:MAG: hypothetical protein LC720_00510, partial [Actinobacteria bacterium]|nr:hypothetical protein [Actinomycetota bacterium]